MAAPKKSKEDIFMFEILEYGEHTGIIAETYQEALEYIHLRSGRLSITEGVQYNEDIHSWETVDLPRFVARVNKERFEIIEATTVKEELETLKSPRVIAGQVDMFIRFIKDLDKNKYTSETLKTIDTILNIAEFAASDLEKNINSWKRCNEIYRNLIFAVRSLTGDYDIED